MSELDGRLRDALRRKEPSAGFAERVIQRAMEPSRVESTARARRRRLDFRRPIVRWAAAAALVLTVGGGIHYRNLEHERAERAAGEAAREQVLQALRLTASKLQLAQAKVREVGS